MRCDVIGDLGLVDAALVGLLQQGRVVLHQHCSDGIDVLRHACTLLVQPRNLGVSLLHHNLHFLRRLALQRPRELRRLRLLVLHQLRQCVKWIEMNMAV